MNIADSDILLDKKAALDEPKINVDGKETKTLTAAQRARSERNRQKASALREARLVQRPNKDGIAQIEKNKIKTLDTGGGFLLEDEPETIQIVQHAPGPIVHHADQPICLECEKPFPQSYLLDTFNYSVCNACRDDEDKHSLVTRTEAKSEYLLKDCDLDSRPPPLQCVRRRNPHRARFADMRLYLRAQVEERALQVWGSPGALEREREAREERRTRAAGTAARRRLRALRMDVRSSLFEHERHKHEHIFGPEIYNADTDLYQRTCDCGYVDNYEKM